jgi:excisionase family DNA binding protein
MNTCTTAPAKIDGWPAPLLQIEDTSAILGLSHWTLRRFVRDGRLRAVRIGRRLMIEASEVERFIEEGRK